MRELFTYLFSSTIDHCENFIGTMKEIVRLQKKVENKLEKENRLYAFTQVYFGKYSLHVLDIENESIVKEIDTLIKYLYNFSLDIFPSDLSLNGLNISQTKIKHKAGQDLIKSIERNKQLFYDIFGQGSVNYTEGGVLSYHIFSKDEESHCINMNLSHFIKFKEYLDMVIASKLGEYYQIPQEVIDKLMTYMDNQLDLSQYLSSISQAYFDILVTKYIIYYANEGILSEIPSHLNMITEKIIIKINQDIENLKEQTEKFLSAYEKLDFKLSQAAKQITDDYLRPTLSEGLPHALLEDKFTSKKEAITTSLLGSHTETLPDEYYVIMDGRLVLIHNDKDGCNYSLLGNISTNLERLPGDSSNYTEE